jgi:YVTN family beta-propeller protein
MPRKLLPFLLALFLISTTLVAASHASPFAYISNYDNNSVSVINMASDTVVTTVNVGTGPYGLAVNPAGTRVYVANLEGDNVSVIDTATNTVVDTVVVGDGPFGVAVNPEGTKVYVTNSISNTVSVFDTATGNVIAIVDVGSIPYGITVNPAGTKVYVANLGSNDVSVINTTSDTVVATVPVGTGPYGVAVNPAGTRAYVTNRDSNNVSLIDTATNTVIAPTIPMGINPCGLAVNPAGTRVYVANWHSNSVSVINTGDNSVASIAVGTFPDGVAVSPDGTRVYGANYGSNNVSVIDTADNSVVATVTVGSGPIAFGNFIASPPTITEGLVSFWRGENNAFDVIGGNNGTWAGTSAYAPGIAGEALSLNGNSKMSVPAFDMGSDWTIAAWVNPHGCSDNSHCPVIARSLGNQDGLVLTYLGPSHGSANQFALDIGDGAWKLLLYSGTKYPMNQWHQVVASKSGDIFSLYVDGMLKAQQTVPGVSTSYQSRNVEIGHWFYGVGEAYTAGLIDDVAIYIRALSAKEVLRMYDPNGPVSWWRGEDNAADSIGSNDGTWQGIPAYGPGVFGNALVLNGVDNQVNIPDSPSLNFVPTSPMSLSFWFKRGDDSTTANLIGKRNGCGSGEIHYQVAIDPTNRLHLNSGGQIVSFNTIPPAGAWNHAAVSFDGGTVSLYLNGELVNSAAITLGGATSAQLEIGNSGTCPRFNGQIDDVKIYNRPLSASEVANNYGLVSWWKGENNSLDSAGNNNGVWSGTPAYAGGIDGEAFSFDGSGNSVTVPASSKWAFGNGDFAVSFWAYGTTNDDHRPLINNRRTPASDNMWAIEIYPVANRVEFHSGLTIFLTATNLLTSSSWNHIAVTRSGSTLSMYINGVPSGSAGNSTNFSEINDLQIGRDVMSGNDLLGKSFQGLIDDVKIFSRALSLAEVGTLSGLVPNPFSFTPQTGVALNTVIESDSITVTGIIHPTAISIIGGEYSVSTNGGTTWGVWINGAGTVQAGNFIKVRLTSSSLFASATSTTLTIGGVSAAFTITTRSAPADNWSAFTASSYGGGSGSAVSPFLIANAAQLAKLSSDAAGDPASTAGMYFALTADIDLAAHQWTPVPHFRGTFDGQGRKILNLTIDNSGTNYQGLFGQINSGASIANLGAINSNIVGGTYNGAIAGFASSATVTGCYSTGTINGHGGNGGLVGAADTALTISHSWSSCSVTARSENDQAWSGGLVGPLWGGTSTISNSFATGTVTGWENTGGLVGIAYHSGSLTMTNCYSSGNVITQRTNHWWGNVGGLLGTCSSSVSISNSYHSGAVTMLYPPDNAGKTGGIVGGNDGYPLSVTNSYYNSVNTPGQGGGTPTSTTDMQAAGFVTTLNGSQDPAPWLADSGNANGGFPILAGMPGIIRFISQTGMPLNTPIISNPITVNFIGGSASISISGGDYSISTDGGANWGGWTSEAGTISLNNQVRVRQTSSAGNSTLTTAILTIGGVSSAFDVTTAAANDPNASGLVSWWRAENNGYDSVGGNHGTVQGGTAYDTGRVGQAFSLDGNTYIHIATATPLDRMPQFTLSAWLKIRGSHGAGTHLISGRAAGTQLYTDGSGYLVFNIYDGSTWYPVTSKAPLPLETWVHIAGTLNTGAGESNLYINGVLDGSASVSTLPAENSNPFNIGGFTGYGSYLNGLIDEVKLYNRPLSAVELGRIYGIVPDPFSFNSVTDATRSATVESESINITGLSHPAAISISGGAYEINGSGTWTDSPGTVNPGDTVKVSLTSAASFATTTTATLTIGGVSGTFSVTTLADTEKPQVTGFSLAETESTSMTVAISSFTATDNDTVSGWLVNTSATPPSPADTGWSGTAPTSIILSTAGSNVLRAWVKDPAGNVSDPRTATVLLKPVRLGTSTYTYYDSLSVACADAASGETIRALAVTVPGNVTLSGGRNLTLRGGYADGYDTQSGYSALQGTLTVGTGTLTVDRLVIR